MFRKTTKMIRLIWVAAMIASLLLTAGCGGGTAPETTMPETTVPITTSQPPETTDPVVKTDGLMELRQAMIGTPEQLAVAYFDYVGYAERSEVHDEMRSVAPGLCEDLPFLTEIPEDRMVGGKWGDLFCVVPRDPDASIVVMHGVWDENDEFSYSECIYEWSKGEPILLLCNDEGMDPDTIVIITNPDGSQYTWFPTLDDHRFVDQIYDDGMQEQIKDFTAYEELLSSRYHRMISEGWKVPTEDDIVGTTWITDRWLSDGSQVENEVIFNEDYCDVFWTVGDDYHEYLNAYWFMETVNGYPVLSIDFGEFAGVQRFNVLWSEQDDMLFTMLDISDGVVDSKWDLMWQILMLDESELVGADPMALAGNWELGWTEVDGYQDDSEAGKKILTITGDSEEDLRATLVDNVSPHLGFTNKALNIVPGELYFGCGNNRWIADVDYIGADDLQFSMTVLDNGALLMQMTWAQDGYLASACAWYVRAG